VRLPDGLPGDLVPELAARDGDRTEVYLRRSVAAPWGPFARLVLDLVGSGVPQSGITPRPVVGAHCLSLAWTDGTLDAVTVYAADRCLPDDRTVAAAWSPGLAPEDRRTYEATLGAVRSLGRVGHHPVHGLLAWTARADGSTSRAVSLRVADAPPPAQARRRPSPGTAAGLVHERPDPSTDRSTGGEGSDRARRRRPAGGRPAHGLP
jgi:hypothetical protein